MKTLPSTLLIFLVLSIMPLAGCKTAEAPHDNASKSAPETSSNPVQADNSNQSTQTAKADQEPNPSPEGGAPASKPGSPAQLIGIYESTEVQSGGVVTLLSQLKTMFLFSADGSYSRESKVKGKPYHSDSGTFRIEPPDKLILNIQVTGLKAQRKIQSPPLTKTHRFSLSSDGDQLTLISADGKTALFRRVSKPKTT
jgi:hypothetical protein